MIPTYLGIDVYFSQTSIGSQSSKVPNDPSTPGNHRACLSGGLIEWAKDKEFTEYLVKVDRNSYVTSEDETESLFSFGEIMQTIKREIIYVEK